MAFVGNFTEKEGAMIMLVVVTWILYVSRWPMFVVGAIIAVYSFKVAFPFLLVSTIAIAGRAMYLYNNRHRRATE